MTSVVAPSIGSILRAPVPLQVEISAQFLAGVAGTILLMLLFLMVVVLWDIALALRDVAEKIDYLEDDVDSDLATINGTLTRIYDRMGTGSGGSTPSEGAAGAPGGVRSTNGTGDASGMPVGAGGSAAATEPSREVSDEGTQTAGGNVPVPGVPTGAGATAAGGRRRVANAPTAENAEGRAEDSLADETPRDVEDGEVDDTGSTDDHAPDSATAENSPASTDSPASDESPASTDSPASDELNDPADASAPDEPTTRGEPTAGSGVMRAGDAPAPDGADANVGRFASDGSGDEAWYDVTMDVPRTADERDSPGDDELNADGTRTSGLNESGLRASEGETAEVDGSSVNAGEVMQSDAVREGYVDPVSSFGDDEFNVDRSESQRRVSLADLREDGAGSAEDTDEPTNDDAIADDDAATDDDAVVDRDATADDGDDPAGGESDVSPAVEEGDVSPAVEEGDASPAVEEGDASPAVEDQNGIDPLDDAGAAVVDGELGAPAGTEVRRSRAGSRAAADGDDAGADGQDADGEDADDEDTDRQNAEETAVRTVANTDVEAPDESFEELFDAAPEPAGEDVNAVEDALAERREETDGDDGAVDAAEPSVDDENADGGGIADLVNRELDTLTEEVGGTSMTPDVFNVELDAAVDELDDGSYTFPLSGSSFNVTADAEAETATLSFTPEEPLALDGARERLLKYQLRNYLDRDDTAHADLSVDGSTVNLEIPAANGPAVDAWADAAVQIIDRTLYLSKDE
jgi:hypothetical protein